jgi:hypothetical protein
MFQGPVRGFSRLQIWQHRIYFLYFVGTGIHGLLDNTGTIGDNVGSWEYDETTGVINADDNYDNDGVAAPGHANL